MKLLRHMLWLVIFATLGASANIIISSGPKHFAEDVLPPGSDPSWFTALSELQGTYRGTNDIDDIKPGGVGTSEINDVFISWNGGALDDDSDTFCTGPPAGHNNYKGGEVYCYFIIGDGTHTAETWYRMYPTDLCSGSGDGICDNGMPKDTHTYDELVFVEGEMWLGAMGSVEFTGGTGSARGWVWDFDHPDVANNVNTRGWTDLGVNTLSGGDKTGAVIYDPVTDKVWYSKRFTSGGLTQMASWNRSTKARTQHTLNALQNFGSDGDMSAAAIYSGSDSVYLGIGNNSGSVVVRTIDLQDLLVGPASWQSVTWSGTAPTTGKVRLHFVPETNQLVTWEIGTNNLLVANVPANFHTGTFTWFRVALTGATITGPSGTGEGNVNGTFGRFQIFRMPSGALAVFLANEVTEQVYFAKLPATPMSAANEPEFNQFEEVIYGQSTRLAA